MGIPHFRKPPYTEQHRRHHARHYHICHHWQDDSNPLEPCSLGILRTMAALDMFACVISKGAATSGQYSLQLCLRVQGGDCQLNLQ